jgi:hypothetical protein
VGTGTDIASEIISNDGPQIEERGEIKMFLHKQGRKNMRRKERKQKKLDLRFSQRHVECDAM